MLIINHLKFGEDPKSIILNEGDTLIDYIHDSGIGTNHTVFNSGVGNCTKKTMIDKHQKEHFLSESGEYTIIEMPGDPFTIIYAIVAVVSIAYAVYVYNNIEIPGAQAQDQSANNTLRARQNRERPLQRIEDIAGKVRSYPTLIQQVYKKFTSFRESEYSLMAVSVGEGLIEQVRESETLFSSIPGAGASFYNPYKMPSVDTPSLTVGTGFTEPVKVVIRSNEVTGGQVLDFNSDDTLFINTNALWALPNVLLTGNTKFSVNSASTSNFSRFNVGDNITVSYEYDDGGIIRNLDGTYKIVAFTNSNKTIEISAPSGAGAETVNANWALSNTTKTNISTSQFALETSSGTFYAGPYFLNITDKESFFYNIVANGLQANDGDPITVQFRAETAVADSSGNQIGSWVSAGTQSITAGTRERIGVTITVPTAQPYLLVRFSRLTAEIKDAQLQNIELDALYTVSPIGVLNFGNVTTVQVRTTATPGATQLKERKFNLYFTRKLNLIQSDGSLGSTLQPTTRFIDYYAYATLSSTIGRRQLYELNTLDLYNRYQEMTMHFGSTDGGEFSYTFDTDQMSFQQILQTIAGACFGNAVRLSGVITFRPEMPGDPRTIFTHRNKIPNSQTISRSFESEGKKDGVELQYVDPVSAKIITLKVPTNASALRPEKIETKGVRNHNQAWWIAQRRYAKILSQRITVSDKFTAEGALLSVGDIIAITNNTKIKPQSGDVVGVNGLVLRLSEPVFFDECVCCNHYIALRMDDGSIDVIECFEGTNEFEVVLSRPPVDSIYTQYEREKTKFIFTSDETLSAQKFIVTEVNRDDEFEIPVVAVNYDDSYYAMDGTTSPNN